jgi:hypothetical protein
VRAGGSRHFISGTIGAPRYRLLTASLEVNLATQVTYYVRNGTIQRIIDASTGSEAWYYSRGRWARAVTPTGRFRIYWRCNGPDGPHVVLAVGMPVAIYRS